MTEKIRWWTVVAFAVAMAWVESAVVFYLRSLSGRLDPAGTTVLPPVAGIAQAESVREAATLIMLLAVGLLAGKNWRSRWGYGAIAFGVWDIFYYVFLKVITGWPNHLLDWDVLFLLPLPWWGPVLAPVLIALMMIVWGTLVSQWEESHRHPLRAEWKAWTVNFGGMAMALYVFMEQALHVSGKDNAPLAWIAPARFNWPLFLVALGLMAAPVLSSGMRVAGKSQSALVNS